MSTMALFVGSTSIALSPSSSPEVVLDTLCFLDFAISAYSWSETFAVPMSRSSTQLLLLLATTWNRRRRRPTTPTTLTAAESFTSGSAADRLKL
ncbi:uncharacterized protein A4U43_C03F2940, partial [Asparagus officinalis]